MSAVQFLEAFAGEYLPSGLQDTPEWQRVVEVVQLFEAAAAMQLEWFEKERAGPQYGSLTRDTHPLGEQIWCQWWNEQLDLCADTETLCRAALAKARGETPIQEDTGTPNKLPVTDNGN